MKVLFLSEAPRLYDATADEMERLKAAHTEVKFFIDGVTYYALCKRESKGAPLFADHAAEFLEPAIIHGRDKWGDIIGLTPDDISIITDHLRISWNDQGKMDLQITGADIPAYQPYIY